MLTATTNVDPMMTVLREGGAYHTRGRLPAYLAHLRATGSRPARGPAGFGAPGGGGSVECRPKELGSWATGLCTASPPTVNGRLHNHAG